MLRRSPSWEPLHRSVARLTALGGLVVALLLFAPSSARAQVDLDRSGAPTAITPLRIAIVPGALPLFRELDVPVAPPDPERLDAVIRAHFDAQRYFVTVTDADVGATLRSAEIARALDTSRLKLGYGQQHFHAFDPSAAIRDLGEARTGFEAAYGALLEPSAYADTLQYLSFALLDRSDAGGDSDDLVEARIAMRELVRNAPHIVLDPDRQPAQRVELYRDARSAVLGERSLRAPAQQRATDLADALDVDYLLFARLVQVDASWRLEFDVFDVALERFLPEIGDVTLPGDPVAAVDIADAHLSRFTSCIPPRMAPPAPTHSDAGRWFLDLAFDYFVFAQSPARDPFDNIGLGFGAVYMVSDLFALMGRTTVTFSGEDSAGDLRSTFTVFRGIVGVGVAVPLRWVRPFFYGGVEVANATPFFVTRNPQCKVGEDPVADNPLCRAADVSREDVGVLFGLYATAGVSINLGLEALFATARTSIAYYFPFAGEPALNLPVGFDLGLEVRF